MAIEVMNHNFKLGKALRLLNQAATEKKEDLFRDYRRVKKMAVGAYQKSRAKVRRTAGYWDKEIHSAPWKCVAKFAAGALVIGFLLGLSKRK